MYVCTKYVYLFFLTKVEFFYLFYITYFFFISAQTDRTTRNTECQIFFSSLPTSVCCYVQNSIRFYLIRLFASDMPGRCGIYLFIYIFIHIFANQYKIYITLHDIISYI